MIDKENAQIDQGDQHVIVAEGAQLLGAEPEYVGDRSAHGAGLAIAPACAEKARLNSVSTGMKSASATTLAPRSAKPSPLVKVPTLIVQEIGHREDVPDDRAARRTGKTPASACRRTASQARRQDRGAEQGGDLGAGKRGYQHAVAGRRGDVEQGAERERREAALERHAENEKRHQQQHGEIDQRHGDVGKLLAEREIRPGSPA